MERMRKDDVIGQMELLHRHFARVAGKHHTTPQDRAGKEGSKFWNTYRQSKDEK